MSPKNYSDLSVSVNQITGDQMITHVTEGGYTVSWNLGDASVMVFKGEETHSGLYSYIHSVLDFAEIIKNTP